MLAFLTAMVSFTLLFPLVGLLLGGSAMTIDVPSSMSWPFSEDKRLLSSGFYPFLPPDEPVEFLDVYSWIGTMT
jgi:hypothetical protein